MLPMFLSLSAMAAGPGLTMVDPDACLSAAALQTALDDAAIGVSVEVSPLSQAQPTLRFSATRESGAPLAYTLEIDAVDCPLLVPVLARSVEQWTAPTPDELGPAVSLQREEHLASWAPFYGTALQQGLVDHDLSSSVSLRFGSRWNSGLTLASEIRLGLDGGLEDYSHLIQLGYARDIARFSPEITAGIGLFSAPTAQLGLWVPLRMHLPQSWNAELLLGPTTVLQQALEEDADPSLAFGLAITMRNLPGPKR